MLEKSRNAVFFQWFVCQVSRKVGLLKRRVRRYVLSREIQKLHAAVAKRTFTSQNVKKLTVSEHFLKLRCRKIAHRCGETHICKWKCTKHFMFGALFEVEMSKNCTPLWRNAHSQVKMLKTDGLGALFEVEMSKNCTPLWRNAHLQVKMLKNWRSRSTFWSSDVEKLHAAVAKRTFTSQNVKKLTVSEHFLKFWCPKIARRCGAKHILKWKCTKYLCFGTLFQVQMSKNQSVSKFVSQSLSQVVK